MNFLTIDVEDYFQVHALSGVIRPGEWEAFEPRVERNTQRILELLAEAGCKATFFVLGWVAERFPGLVKAIDGEGHEVASHGSEHQLASGQSQEEFRRDVRRSKEVLEGTTGRPVVGYRAPTYSITESNLWALSVLAEEGYKYDSSVFPVHHDSYGVPSAPRAPFKVDAEEAKASRLPKLDTQASVCGGEDGFRIGPGEILEVPVSTVRLLGQNLPISGGGYFRILPYAVVRWGLKRINREEGPFVFYIHPWEIDPDQPRVKGLPWRSRFRHYTNLKKTEARFVKLLSEFSFGRMDSILAEEG